MFWKIPWYSWFLCFLNYVISRKIHCDWHGKATFKSQSLGSSCRWFSVILKDVNIIIIYYIFTHTVKNALKRRVLTSETLLKSFFLQILLHIFILHGTVLCNDIYHKYNLNIEFFCILHTAWLFFSFLLSFHKTSSPTREFHFYSYVIYMFDFI